MFHLKYSFLIIGEKDAKKKNDQLCWKNIEFCLNVSGRMV